MSITTYLKGAMPTLRAGRSADCLYSFLILITRVRLWESVLLLATNLLDVSVLCVSILVSPGNEDREGDPGVVMTLLQRPYHERRAQFIA